MEVGSDSNLLDHKKQGVSSETRVPKKVTETAYEETLEDLAAASLLSLLSTLFLPGGEVDRLD